MPSAFSITYAGVNEVPDSMDPRIVLQLAGIRNRMNADRPNGSKLGPTSDESLT